MARYILKRLLWIIPVVLGVTIMVFTIMYLTPGDPARMILGSNATEEKVEELHEQLGMNGNYFQRLGRYMKQVFIDHDLGSSYYTGVRVTDQIKARLPFTLRIAGISILIAACIGIPLGVLAATHHYTWIDNLAMFGSLFCVSMPGFWFALILVSFFAIKLSASINIFFNMYFGSYPDKRDFFIYFTTESSSPSIIDCLIFSQ